MCEDFHVETTRDKCDTCKRVFNGAEWVLPPKRSVLADMIQLMGELTIIM